MRVQLASVTPGQLKTAGVIEAVDPRQPSYHQQVWGQDVAAPIRPYPSGPGTIQVVEVEIDSSRPEHLQDLLRLVVTTKGRLPPEAEALKQ